MELKLLNPAKIILPSDSEEVKQFLSFKDRGVQYQMKRLKDNFRWRNSDPDSFDKRMAELKEQSTRCLLSYCPETGLPVTYAGLWPDLQKRFRWENSVVRTLPEGKNIPWAHTPQHEPRYYQHEACEALINAVHGAIELPTGSGKSTVIFMLCKRLGLPTVIQSPSATITDQLYNEMVHLFGKKYVGKYAGAKKELGKLFTVCTAQSLVNIERGTEAWDFFSTVQAYMCDESHTVPAETFESVAMELMKNATYRFFVSATQVRGDGSEMVLKGVTGPVVYRKDFKELVEQGYLSKPTFKVFKVPSHGFAGSPDINKETKNQLYLNPNVNKLAAEIAIKCVTLLNRQTVILLEEFDQFLAIKDRITVPFEFVHGGSTNREVKKGKNGEKGTTLRDILPEQYWKSDTEAAIERFNKGETRLLIGTSAISTGVDLRPTGALIYLQGGLSEIKVKQGVGRGTRVTPDKKDLLVFDFKVMGSTSMERHADSRVKIYESLGEVAEIG